MPSVPVIVRFPRPSPEVALPRSEGALSPSPTHQPDERRIGVPARLRSAFRVALLCSIAIVALLIAAIVSAGCAPERPPLPAPDLPAQVERIDRGIWAHELAVARWRAER